ncbi:Clp protease ClpP [Blautia liquoris]|uniref:ATP-dependent Clp protease proteolytic subunit n=1 Tax=Blautia liquoris TaxID=2779518 RepID=A0A7M2RDZ5_9FIRM|nr:head maturation protease, ClpP-related [Blautia liquoris]QOV18194.1 Clp protease ClpP [Blautia liquoris]
MKKFWNWSVKDSNRILTIDGTIAEESWFDDDVTPKIFKEELNNGDGAITLWLNSPGGDCIAASQIYTMLMEYSGDVQVKVDGLAASAASVIAVAGTTVSMASTSMMMIHNPFTMAMGDTDEMKKAIDMLTQVKESIINAYEIKTGLSRSRIANLMDAETWMNAKKAIELGFADDILQDNKKEAIDGYSFSMRTVANALWNKARQEKKADPPQTKEPMETIESLKKRLSIISH